MYKNLKDDFVNMRQDYLNAINTIQDTETEKDKIKEDILFLEEKLSYLIETSKFDPFVLETDSPEEDDNQIMIPLAEEVADLPAKE